MASSFFFLAFISDFFHLAKCFSDSSILLHVSVIPFYCWVLFSCYNMFIHSSVINGYLDCFQFGPVMNEVTMNILV